MLKLKSSITGEKKQFYLVGIPGEWIQYTWLWKLENFGDTRVRIGEGDKYQPPIPLSITAPNKTVESWNLEFYPQGYKLTSYKNSCFLIWRDERRAQRDLKPEIKISLLDCAMERIKTVTCKEYVSTFTSDNFIAPHEYLASPITPGIILTDKAGILDHGCLSICVEFTFPVSHNAVPVQSSNVILEARSQFFSSLSKYVDTPKFSDVVLEVKGVELKAHKVLLATQSPVFTTMFEQDGMTENTENRVKIDDIEPEVAKQMLEFIYTDRAPSRIDEFAGQLVAAAHKYQMERLSTECEGTLIKKITRDNTVETLIFADTYDLKHLKKGVCEFIKKDKSLLETEEFDELERDHPELTFEIYREIMSVKRQRTTDPGPSQEN